MFFGEKTSGKLLVLLWGAALSTTQIIIFREYVCFSGGNELALGISLSVWLLFNAIGALVWMGIRHEVKGRSYIVIISGLLFGLLSIILLRYARLIIRLPLGAPPDFSALLVSSIFSVMPPAFISGFSFPYFCTILKNVSQDMRVGFIYALESFGLVLGYLMTTLFIYTGMSHMTIILLVYLISFAFSIHFKVGQNLIKTTLFFIFCIFLILSSEHLDNTILRNSFEASYNGFSFVAHRDTNYNRYIIARRGEEYTLFINNQFSKTIADEYSSKVFSHLAMTISDKNGRVLVVGEASYDILKHMLEHRPLVVDYIEYDRNLSGLIREYIRGVEIESPSIKIINDDARRFIQGLSNHYDVIVLDIPEPENLQLNRFFTVEFFEAAKRRLKRDGILIFSLSSIASQASFSKMDLVISIYRAAKTVFSNVIPLAYDKIYFFSSDASLNVDFDNLINKYRGYKIECDFEPELMSLALDEHNNKKILNILTSKEVGANRDKNPYALFASLMLYEMSSGDKKDSILPSVRKIKFYQVIAIICVLFLITFIFSKKGRFLNCTLMASQGFVSMSLEIIIIYLFQVKYGILYQYMAVLFAIFMLGLAVGSIYFHKFRLSPSLLSTLNIIISFILLFFDLTYVFLFLLLFSEGLITGIYFGYLSASLIDSREKTVLQSASLIDFSDSFGAMLAGLFLPVVFLPLYNFSNTIMIVILVSFLATLAYYIGRYQFLN